MQRKQTSNWHPISVLPLFSNMIQVGLEGTTEQYAALKEAENRPYVLDDYTVNRVLDVFTTQRDDLWVFEEQFARWHRGSITSAQRTEVERLAAQLTILKKKVHQILALAEELKKGTIDTVLAMSDEEVATATLTGKLQRPQAALPTLTVNGHFMRAFLDAEAPCCALGMVEVEGAPCGLIALRPPGGIPAEITDLGFRLGHSILGTSGYEVVHFAFEFYGFETYNVLVNPGSPLVKAVLNKMIATGDYFFFALNSNRSVTAFRSEIGAESLVYLKAHRSRLQQSGTTEEQYRKAVSLFKKNPEPAGTLLDWVCRDNPADLDLTRDRFDLTPS